MARIFWAFLASGLIQVAGLVTGLVAARILGPEGRGALAGIVSVTMAIGAISGLSISEAVAYFTARAETVDERSKILSTGLVCALVLSIGGIITASAVGLFAFKGDHHRPEAFLFLLNIPLLLATNCFVASAQSSGGARSWSVLRSTPQAVNAFLCIVAIAFYRHAGISYFLVSQIAGNVVLLVISIVMLRRRGVVFTGWNRAQAGTLFGFGVRLHATSVGQNARDHLDRIVMAIFLPNVALGYYAATTALASSIAIIGVTIDIIAMPNLARASFEDRKIGAMTLMKISALVIFCAGLFMSFASQFLIPVLFGKAFLPAMSLAPVLCAAYAMAALKSVVASVLKASNRPLSAGGVEIVTLIVMVFAMPPLVFSIGAFGAGLSALLAQSSALIIILVIVNREYSYGASDWFSVSQEVVVVRQVISRVWNFRRPLVGNT